MASMSSWPAWVHCVGPEPQVPVLEVTLWLMPFSAPSLTQKPTITPISPDRQRVPHLSPPLTSCPGVSLTSAHRLDLRHLQHLWAAAGCAPVPGAVFPSWFSNHTLHCWQDQLSCKFFNRPGYSWPENFQQYLQEKKISSSNGKPEAEIYQWEQSGRNWERKKRHNLFSIEKVRFLLKSWETDSLSPTPTHNTLVFKTAQLHSIWSSSGGSSLKLSLQPRTQMRGLFFPQLKRQSVLLLD